MRAALTITRTELGRVVRDRMAMFMILVLPVVIIVIISNTFFSQEVFPIGLVRQGRGPLADELVDRLERSASLEVSSYESASDVRGDVRRNRLVAGVIVPAGYDRALRGGGETRVTVVSDPADEQIAAVRTLVAGVVDGQGGRVAAARFAAEQSGLDLDRTYRLAGTLARGIRPVGVESSAVSGGGSEGLEGRFSYTVPANLVLFVFITSLMAGSVLVYTRQLGVTARLLAAPTSPWSIVLGIGLSRLALSLLQAGLMIGVGALLFDVGWGDPVGVAALVLVFAAVATSVGLLVGATARNGEQVQAVGVPVGIGLGMLGGCMWPLWIVPEAMRTVGHLTPHAWAMDAWVDLIIGEDGVNDILKELGVLSLFVVVLAPLAVRRLRANLLN